MKFVRFGFYLLFLVSLSEAQNCADSSNIFTFFYDGNKYEVVRENKTWIEAAVCADARGGILAHINSQQEMDSVFYYINEAGIVPANTEAPDGGNASYIWIGGNDLQEEGKWVWDGSNYGLGVHFWQGTVEGTAVDNLYNNWGNEPDNFSNQDGLGLAITNWPRGTAGQWNDVDAYNKLYYLVEYDHSTIPLNRVDYLYPQQMLAIYPDITRVYDSIQVLINDKIFDTLFNVGEQDTVLSVPFSFDTSQVISVRIFAFYDSIRAASRQLDLDVYVFKDPVSSYLTDFENTPANDFMGNDFTIERIFGFTSKALHSLHDYEINAHYTLTLTRPIIVNETDARLIYSDVAIVEPGGPATNFGDENFKDYVIVEGSKTAGEWQPLVDGYDARLFPEWHNAWDNSSGLYRTMFKSHTIYLHDTFAAGDTILVRFRLYSDQDITGWGWVIDSLQIQDVSLGIADFKGTIQSFALEPNFPNPFNPTTKITMHIAEAGQVKLEVYDSRGRVVSELLDKKYLPGIYSVTWDATGLSSGVYYIHMQAAGQTFVRKSVLIR